MRYTQPEIKALEPGTILIAKWPGDPFFAAALMLPTRCWHNLWGTSWPEPEPPLFDLTWDEVIAPDQPHHLRDTFAKLYDTIEASYD